MYNDVDDLYSQVRCVIGDLDAIIASCNRHNDHAGILFNSGKKKAYESILICLRDILDSADLCSHCGA